MISTGINLANYGFIDSAGNSEAQPQHYTQVVVHTSIGKYVNGVVGHGLSGGGGMCTLWDTDGNEFSHEMGHNFNLGHYPGAGQGSIHSSGSGWGFDVSTKNFIANFDWESPPSDSSIPDDPNYKVAPFAGHFKYNFDAMAGGAPSGTLSRFTHHTNYVSKHIQEFFMSKAILAPSGYLKWDDKRQEMVPHNIGWPVPIQHGVPVITLVGFVDPTGECLPSIHALIGNYGHIFELHSDTIKPGELYLELTAQGIYLIIPLSNTRLGTAKMNKFHINIPQTTLPRKATFRTGPTDKDIKYSFNLNLTTPNMNPATVISY
jgi:hypothetical protein